MDKNGARFLGPQEFQGKLDATEIFRAINQDGIARLQPLRQILPGIAIQELNVLASTQFCFGGNCVVGFSVQFHADDACVRKAPGKNKSAFPASTPRLKNLLRRARLDGRKKKEHLAFPNPAKPGLGRNARNNFAEFRQERFRAVGDSATREWNIEWAHRPMIDGLTSNRNFSGVGPVVSGSSTVCVYGAAQLRWIGRKFRLLRG